MVFGALCIMKRINLNLMPEEEKGGLRIMGKPLQHLNLVLRIHSVDFLGAGLNSATDLRSLRSVSLGFI
ncbi:MAG: hypothetical protein A3C35_04795 [Omnitrophica bacterium RIFCSPHIGHO2_02_FULL_46_11]|nr:MAG: hypothetical protein A3C35_04795 [Omnitrophica bacterium RIFCSPHIGHO2_02_FULL_46_11]OGW87756.1 MAG: hypothetical protein A3A81_01485 [Omnitrophica bacterium RIFCSPLOWO2_01_FULL_45_10b]